MSQPDYAISCVTYSKNDKHIDRAGVRPYAKLSQASEEWSREQILESIDAGKTFITIYRDRNGLDLKAGAKVHAVKVNGTRFITTDPDETKEDNLHGVTNPCPAGGEIIEA